MKESTKILLNELRRSTSGMSLPDYRREDPKWLVKNLKTRNGNHPNLNKVIELAINLIKIGL